MRGESVDRERGGIQVHHAVLVLVLVAVAAWTVNHLRSDERQIRRLLPYG